MSGTTNKKNLGGRPKSTLLEVIRTRTWVTYLVQSTGASSVNELNYALFVPVGKKVVWTTYKKMNHLLTVRWDRHIEGISPNESQLNLVEQKALGKGSKKVFDIGPLENGKNVHLWCVFEMDMDALWNPIEDVCKELQVWRKRGAPFSVMVEWMAHSLMKPGQWKKLNFKDPTTHPDVNAVVKAYQEGDFTPSFRYLAAAMAMWRIALHRSENMAQMEYLVRGLLAEPCKRLLSEQGIYSQFVLAFNQLEIYDLLQKGEVDLAKKLLAKLTDTKALA